MYSIRCCVMLLRSSAGAENAPFQLGLAYRVPRPLAAEVRIAWLPEFGCVSNGPMSPKRSDPASSRPWTVLTATLTAAHHGFELSNGVGLVGQPELGLVGSGALWATQIPTWIAIATKGGGRWNRLLAVWSGAALGGAAVHFLIWPRKRGALGLPVLAEAEGLGPASLPAYNTLLYAWGLASALSIVLETPRRDRRWALLGLATLPLLRVSAKHHFSWIVDQAVSNPAWWNRGVRPTDAPPPHPSK